MLAPYLRRRVSVVTTDGRYLVGILHAADQLLNIVLTSCTERVFDEPVTDSKEEKDENNNNINNINSGEMQELQIGVMMLRGSDVVCVAAINTLEEAKINTRDWRGCNIPIAERVPRSIE